MPNATEEKHVTQEMINDLPWQQMYQMTKDYQNKNIPDDFYELGLEYICRFLVGPILRYTENLMLIRMRKNLTEQELLEQGCWYPKDNCKIPQGRFNNAGQAMAYFCLDTATAEAELRVHESECKSYHHLRAHLIESNLRIPIIFPVNATRDIEKNHLFGGQRKLLDATRGQENENIFRKMCLATEFIGDEFCKEDADYKLTNTISKILLSSPNNDGLLYPSVRTGLRLNNIVFRPKVADRAIQPGICVGVSRDGTEPSGACVTNIITYKKDATGQDLSNSQNIAQTVVEPIVPLDELEKHHVKIITESLPFLEMKPLGLSQELRKKLHDYIDQTYLGLTVRNKANVYYYILRNEFGLKMKPTEALCWHWTGSLPVYNRVPSNSAGVLSEDNDSTLRQTC